MTGGAAESGSAGLYLHIPYCRSKCSYCDFYSVPVATAAELEDYTGLLLSQLNLEAATARWPGPFSSVFFGGGTPSLLSPGQIDRILRAVNGRFGLSRDAEITLEANPGTLSATSLAGYRTAGINRLSFGLQSLQAENLIRIGRSHGPEEGRQAFALARQAGFDNLSCDLMFALPGQRLPDLENDIQRYLELGPEHLSCYGLTVEPDTQLAAAVRDGSTLLPDEAFYADAFLCLHERLEAAGYCHYEIANYARPGCASRHNLGYWRRRSSLGLGAGAHSFLAARWGERRAAAADLATYRTALQAGEDPAATIEVYDRRGAMRETLYLGLRTWEGVDQEAFRETFGERVEDAFPEAVRQLSGRLTMAAGCWRLSPTDWLLYDHLIQAFL